MCAPTKTTPSAVSGEPADGSLLSSCLPPLLAPPALDPLRGTLWTAISICGRIPPLMRSCDPVGKCGTSVGRVLQRYRPALQASESGLHLNRSSYVGSRTGCGQVVQCLEG